MIGLHDHLPYRGNYLDLDPNYRDVFGNPLLRVTYDIGPNEHRLSDYMVKVATKIGEVMQPSHLAVFGLPQTFDAGAGYGIVHQVGGAMMGTSPESSVVNKYLLPIILKALRQCLGQPQVGIHLSQQQHAPVAGEGATGKIRRDLARTQLLKKQR